MWPGGSWQWKKKTSETIWIFLSYGEWTRQSTVGYDAVVSYDQPKYVKCYGIGTNDKILLTSSCAHVAFPTRTTTWAYF